MVFNVAKLGRCHNVGIFMVFNVTKLGWCHKDSIFYAGFNISRRKLHEHLCQAST
jgi:hypothetical protein